MKSCEIIGHLLVMYKIICYIFFIYDSETAHSIKLPEYGFDELRFGFLRK